MLISFILTSEFVVCLFVCLFVSFSKENEGPCLVFDNFGSGQVTSTRDRSEHRSRAERGREDW